MKKVISVSNQKGGVGKTTTAVNLASCLAELGKQILLIDMDPQANASSGVGISKNPEGTYKVMLGYVDINEAIEETMIDNLDALASSVELAGIEIELLNLNEKESILKKSLSSIQKHYDYIIIDCPPALSTLTVNALNASNSVIVPIQCEYYALEGVSQLLYTIHLIRDRLNPELTVEGIVFTMTDLRTNLTQEVIENVIENLDEFIFDTIIPRSIKMAEAPSFSLPINFYEPKSAGSIAYKQLAEELLNKENIDM